jgi:hypothetical protein
MYVCMYVCMRKRRISDDGDNVIWKIMTVLWLRCRFHPHNHDQNKRDPGSQAGWEQVPFPSYPSLLPTYLSVYPAPSRSCGWIEVVADCSHAPVSWLITPVRLRWCRRRVDTYGT